jgi:hypothetical protein
MARSTHKTAWTLAFVLLAAGCPAKAQVSPSAQAVPNPAGALVKMEMDSTVGVLLDEIPAAVRDQAAAKLLAERDEFWIDRAAQQIWLTDYRLDFRGFYYPDAVPPKGSLPLPPSRVRHYALTGPVHRTHIGTHDYVAVNYHFSTYIITDAASPGVSEPALDPIGGTWDEPFLLPADPILVFQRTGYACMDEDAIPAGSVFGEAVRYFYDQTCGIETPATSLCHVTQFPNITCADALPRYVGLVTPNMHYTHVDYDPELAAHYRVGSVVNKHGSLMGISKEQLDEHAVVYRYIPPGTCGVGSGPAPMPGWRRFLILSAGVYNDGSEPIDFGDQTLATDPYVTNNVLTPEPNCDSYDHFTGYGNYSFAGALGAKQAYCIGDGDRYLNVENASLATNYTTCSHQGIDTGYGDSYQWGLPNQWVDITDLPDTVSGSLTFALNPDQLICEGQTIGSDNKPVDPTDMAALVFDPTDILNADGQPVGRVRCKRFPNQEGNTSSVPFTTAPGSYVNLGCHNGELGPRRDCGFEARPGLHTCVQGSTVNLKCHTRGSQQVLRICERSEVLRVGVSCTYPDSVYNRVVDGDVEPVSFTCPLVRDSATGAGGYSVYQAPVLPGAASDDIDCAGW